MKSSASTSMTSQQNLHPKETQLSQEHNASSENLPPKQKDPVHVFCRVRPLISDADLSCVRVKNSTTLVLTPPEQELCSKPGNSKETEYIFKHVYEANATQQDVFMGVVQPLVENLIRGRNSLLFTYGINGSGKTYTMTGDIMQRGIMPCCLDVLFRTISDYQTKKYRFKSNYLNGFEILSEIDALMQRQKEMHERFASRFVFRPEIPDPEIAARASCDLAPIQGIDGSNMYAVFITYVEVHNKNVYDLLEDGGIQRNLQSKIIREDANHNMFVHGVTEIEIKSVNDAIVAFQKGQKRKRMAHTVLNDESSSSHCVFNIRLVQAPRHRTGEHIIHDKRTITISQLSFVDLAGSERSSRTNDTEQPLREAGNINSSLMTLRTCLEYLRENQQSTSGELKKVPYQDSKITYLFKKYFEGDGQVAMIVCINPRAEDYDENMQAMKFSEMTQEVQIAQTTPVKRQLQFTTPLRQKATKIFKMAVNNLIEMGHSDAKKLDLDIDLVYTLGPKFPDYKLDGPEAKSAIQDLMKHLIQRIEKRKKLNSDLERQIDTFRLHLKQVEEEKVFLTSELNSLHDVYRQEREHSFALENKLRIQNSLIDVLNNKLEIRERHIYELTRKLNDQQNVLIRKEYKKDYENMKFYSKLQKQIRTPSKDENLKPSTNITQSISKSTENSIEAMESADHCAPKAPRREMAVANKRNRRSRSAGKKWIEHRAQNAVPLGTILQPVLNIQKSVTKLRNAKDLTSCKANKYILVSQEADTDGDVETKLYKGDIIPTCGGGAQVIFNDVECLKQKSPVSSSNRKRRSNVLSDIETTVSVHTAALASVNTSTATDVASSCYVGISSHAVKRTRL